MIVEDMAKKMKEIHSVEELRHYIREVRVIASNRRYDKDIVDLIEEAVKISQALDDKRSLVDLYEIQISQIEHLLNYIPKICEQIKYMRKLAEEIEYIEGIALSYNLEWYVEKILTNKKKSKNALNLSINLLSDLSEPDEYAYFVCNYSFAVEQWLENKNPISSEILERCSIYFYENCFYRSFAQTLGVLLIIYQQTYDEKKASNIARKLLLNQDLFYNLQPDIQGLTNFFIGFCHKLNFNLDKAEKYLTAAKRTLKPSYKESIYSSYYITNLSHLTTTYALQGKMELALIQMNEIEELLEEEITTKDIDSFNKKQIIHTFNLTKFYIKSRLYTFSIKRIQKLVQTILANLDSYYSNAIMLTELLLNANLSKEELQNIKNLNNPSSRRVEHILDFLMKNETHIDESQIIERINALKRRPVEGRMTFTEKAFADLLSAQEYYKIRRFTEIYTLLKKYENQLHRIEVLELRIFLEAFIQVGAYKNGDPLGPALQYMAIKKCRKYGFSRLENNLLDYLTTQRNDALRLLA